MSGRVALREAIKGTAKKQVERHTPVVRGTVVKAKPLTVRPFGFDHDITLDNDFELSGWMNFFQTGRGLKKDDMVLLVRDEGSWVLVDVVTDSAPPSAGGSKGDPGPIGPEGPPGAKGDTGDTGATGATGPQGNTGPAGAPGAPGTNGARGSLWYSYTSSGTPAAGTFTGEADGDYAIRSSDDELFKRVGGAWVDQGFSIKGATGATGATGPPGATGATGATGPQGARGSLWYTYTGLGTPAAGTFTGEADGDNAVRTSDAEVFKRIAGAWVDQGFRLQGTVYDSDQIGAVKSWAGAVIPQNWMLADGRAVQRSDYPDLFASIAPSGAGTTTSTNATVTGVASALLTALTAMTNGLTSGLSIPVSGANVPAGTKVTGYNVAGSTVTLSANANASGATTLCVAPWGVGDGSTTFNLPDLRSRFILGAAQGAAGLTSRLLGVYGGGTLDTNATKLGEETHLLKAAESGVNGSGTTGNPSANHTHGPGTLSTGWFSADHSHHLLLSAGNSPVTQSGGQGCATIGGGSDTGGQSANHYHAVNAGATDTVSAWHTHTLNAADATSAHNNMPPFVAVALIIKVLGVQLNPGGALQGATGQRGTTWFMYPSTGTPPTNYFVGELDGDMAIRTSDGENFKRVSGVWVDQGFTNRSTATTTSGRLVRTTNSGAVAANTWTKVPFDTKTFDQSNNITDLTNSRFVVPTTGVYEVNAQIIFMTTSTGTYTYALAQVYKNGAAVANEFTEEYAAVQNYATPTLNDKMLLTAGDVIELYGYCSQAVPMGNATFLSLTLVTAGPGPQGQRGANWFTYTGSGTPPTGAFAGELDGDMAVRTSDSEVFKRVAGAWVDQGWTMKTGQNTMDTWHMVGAAGEPAFQNGWVNYPSPYGGVSFRKYPDGRVKVKGLTQNGTINGVIFTLPVGYRPPIDEIFSGPNNGAVADLRVNTDGTVVTSGAMGGTAANNGWLSLSVIEFDTESVSVISAGSRGAQWFAYTGAGTPAAGTFSGELDGDMAVRTSDSEVFKRVAGAWTDQAYKAGGTLATNATAARASLSAGNVAYTASTWTKCPLDTLNYDVSSNLWNAASKRFVAPVAGVYRIDANLFWTGTGAAAYLIQGVGIYKNGVMYSQQQYESAVTGEAGISYSDTIQLAQGDFIEVYGYLSVGASWLSETSGHINFVAMSLIAAGQGPQGPQGPAGPAFGGTAKDLVNATPGTIATWAGLNGNVDLTYELIVDVLILNATVNVSLFLLPNGVAQTLGAIAERRLFTTDGATLTSDSWASKPGAGSYPFQGFFVGHADWNTGGRLQSKVRISAAAITSDAGVNSQGAVGRPSHHEGTFLPRAVANGSLYVMEWSGATNWYEGSTNITSLALLLVGNAGALVNGRATLRVVS